MHKVFVLLLASAACCSPVSEVDKDGKPSSGNQIGSECVLNNETAACSCDASLPGRQVCLDGGWSECECSTVSKEVVGSNADASSNVAIDPELNHRKATFSWQATQATSDTCEPGHYEGSFTGQYGPSIVLVADLKPILIVSKPNGNGDPGIAFDLQKEVSGETLIVSNGKMRAIGYSDWVITFEADVKGTLDCNTSKFNAQLVNGVTTIVNGIFPQTNFEGSITADYDKKVHRMAGKWEITETADPPGGGRGEFVVDWIPQSTP